MITMHYFLYGTTGFSAKIITGLPIKQIEFDYSFLSGCHGGPLCKSAFLNRHFTNNYVQVIGVVGNVIFIDIF